MKDFNGFIKIHRQLIEWEWYSNVNCRITLIHCILKANFKDKKWQGHLIKRGSFVTSLSKLSTEIGISIKALRIVFEKLAKTGEIIAKGQGMHTLVIVANFDVYQKKDSNKGTGGAQEGQDKGTGGAQEGQQLKKEKNDNNDKEESNKEILSLQKKLKDLEKENETLKTKPHTFPNQEAEKKYDPRDKRTNKQLPFDLRAAKETLDCIYPNWKILAKRHKENTGRDILEGFTKSQMKSFIEVGITNHYSIRTVDLLISKLDTWLVRGENYQRNKATFDKKDSSQDSLMLGLE